MPTTVNGIGTHYYGKKNVDIRQGTCSVCNQVGPLTSYDTRLWFVIVFVPIIPLGRKRIVDECALCRRHWAVNADQFQMAKQLNVSGALDKYRTEHSTESAIEAHAQLCAFHQFDEAASFRQSVLAEFPHDAELLVSLAVQLEYAGQSDEAAKLLDAGYRLRPDLPMARVAMARRFMREQKLDEARAMLDFLERPGAGQLHSLEPLDVLAGAYQQAKRHEEALSLCRHLLDEFPAVGQSYHFRDFVSRSEKALRRPASILPKREFSWRELFDSKSQTVTPGLRWGVIIAIVAIVAVIALGLNNEYIRRHRPLQLVNSFSEPATIQIDGSKTVTIQGRQEVVLPEGRHRATISGPVEEQVDFELQSGYFDRWFRSPVWLLNVGGKETFSFSTLYYAVNPGPSTSEFIIGEKFIHLKNVDYAFQSPPNSLQVEGKQTVSKTHLDSTPAPDERLMQYLEQNRGSDAALSFAESRLQHKSPSDRFVESYAMTAIRLENTERAKTFLASGLERRPVSIGWHRAYQHLCEGPDQLRLIPKYDEYLKREPNNASLLYLRGRIAETASESRGYFQRAIEADPKLAWPRYSLAYEASSQGNWDESLSQLQKAKELGFDIEAFDEILHLCRMGKGEAEQLVTEYRQSLATLPTVDGARTMLRLCDTLFSLNKPEEAWAEFEKWQASLGAIPEKTEIVEPVKLALQYMAGKLDEMLMSSSSSDEASNYLRLQALLALRKPGDIVNDERYRRLLEVPWNALALSIVLELGGEAQQADTWREKACVEFESSTPSHARIAAMLRDKQSPTAAELASITLSAPQRSILLAAMAVRFPMQRAEWLSEANQLIVMRSPPYHLVRSVTESLQAN